MDDPLPDGGDGRIRAILHAQFHKERFEMRLHSVFRDKKCRGNFLVAPAANEQLQYFHFALRQFGTFLAQRQALRQLRRQFFLSGMDGTNCFRQLILRRVLQQIGFCARIHRAKNILVQIEGGQHNHARFRKFFPDRDRGFHAAHPRQPQIHQHDVRRVLPEQTDGFLAVAGFSHHLQVRLAGDERGEPFAESRMIVHQHDANWMFLLHGRPFANQSPESGTLKIISVPRAESLLIFNSPFNSPARSRMAFRPKPPVTGCGLEVSKPLPASPTTNRKSFSPNSSFTTIFFAFAYFVALKIASWPMRRRLFSMMGAKRRERPLTSTLVSMPVPSHRCFSTSFNAPARSLDSKTCERMFQMELRASARLSRTSSCAALR